MAPNELEPLSVVLLARRLVWLVFKAESMPQPPADDYCDARGVQHTFAGGSAASVVTQHEAEGRGEGQTLRHWLGFCRARPPGDPLRRICGFDAAAGNGASYEAGLEQSARRAGARL